MVHPAARRAIAILTIGAFAVTGANAATLGVVTTHSLTVVDASGTPSTPTVLGCDNFTGTSGANMAGRTVTVAAPCSSLVWTSHLGNWTIQINTAASNNTVAAVATLNSSSADATVQAVITAIDIGGRSGGLVLAHNGIDTYLTAVMTDATPDRIELRLVDAGVSNLLTTVNPTFAATNTLAFTRAGAAVAVALNGTVVISYTLSAGHLTTLTTAGRAGLFGGSTSVRFDDLVVTNP
jgi:hypothetical protein